MNYRVNAHHNHASIVCSLHMCHIFLQNYGYNLDSLQKADVVTGHITQCAEPNESILELHYIYILLTHTTRIVFHVLSLT